MSELFANIEVRRKVDQQLVNGGEALQGKLVAIYFSAHWCPPCRNFTPVLKLFYDQAKAAGLKFEIVFVSFDRSEADLNSYLEESHGDWLYVPYGSEHIQALATKYGVSGIPALVVVRANGDTISANARGEVQSGKPAKAVVEEWLSKA